MNRTLLSLSLALAATSAASAQIVGTDSFLTGGSNYTASSDIDNQTGSLTPSNSPWSSMAWFRTAAVSSPVSSSGLSYTNLNPAASGGSLTMGNGVRVHRPFEVSATGSTSGVQYFSFLFQLTGGTADNYRAIELYNGNPSSGGTRTFQLGLSVTDFGSGSSFGARVNDNNSFRGTFGSVSTSTQLVVLRFDFGTSSNADQVRVYLNSNPLLGEPVTPSLTLTNFDMVFDRVAVANFSGGQGLTFDEFRAGSTYASVIPEPSTYAAVAGVLALGGALWMRRRRS